MRPTYTIEDLEPGDHLCCLYETEEEHRALLTPFLRQGLERGEKVLYIVDARTAEAILDYLRDDPSAGAGQALKVESYLESGQLSLLTADEAYMREGVFDPDGMIALLRSETERALAEGYPALRVTGEMTWALRGLPGSERLVEYESKLNTFFPGSKCLAVCQYDQRRFDPAVLLNVLRTHPIALVGTEVYDNFYYIPPAELLGPHPLVAELRHWLGNLDERKRVEEAYQSLVEQSLQGFAIAQGTPPQLVFVNTAIASILGYTVEELLSLSSEETRALVHPGDQKVFFRRYQDRLTGKPAPPRYEFRAFRKDGVVRWLEMFASHIEYRGKPAVQAAFVDITERKQAEEEIRRLNQFLDSVIDNANVWLNVLDEKANVVLWNKAAEEISGYSREEVVGHGKIWEWLYPDEEYRSEVVAVALAIIEKGEAEEYAETVIRRKDGQTRVISWNSRNLVDEKGAPIGSIALGRDITERKRAEEALREAEERFRTIFENILIGLYRTTPDGRILMANPALVRMLGYSSFEELAQRNLEEEGFEPGHPRLVFKQRIEKEGQVIGLEAAWVRRDGTPLFVRESARAIRDDDGNVLYYEGAVEDITESKRLERETEERRLYLENVLECTPDAIVTLNAQHRILEWNPGAERLFGYTLEEVVGRDIDDLVTGSDHHALGEATGFTRQVLAGESILPTETVRYRKDGTPVDVIVSGSPIWMGDELIGVAAVYTDITERKQLEAQLRQAQKMEALGSLAGGIAHDFNNLLTPIGGFADLLLWKVPKDSQQEKYLCQIKVAAERAAALTRQLRLFTRQEKGERRPVQLNSVVEETRALLEHSIPKEITTELHLEPELWGVEADPSQISQVLMNLCVNARDAMPDGGTLTLETRNVTMAEAQAQAILEARPGRYVCLSVSDSGCGMSPEVQARLFEPFFTTKEVGKGTGLGLAVVYGIVKGHGGFINVHSQEGRGSTFRVYLPVIELAVEEREKVEGLELPIGTETILVVDDEEAVRALGQSILERYGYTVLMAENGVRALEVYQAHQGEIALVVLDVVMPEMGGRECLHRLRELDSTVRVLIATGYTINGSAQELVSEGALGVVEKPFNIEELAIVVREALDG